MSVQHLSFFNSTTATHLSSCHLSISSIINELFNNLYGKFDCFYDFFECVATLDMIVSLSKYSLLSESSIRPMFNSFELHVLDSSHPILTRINNKANREPAAPNSGQKSVGNSSSNSNNYIQYSLKSIKNHLQISAIRPFVILTGEIKIQ